MANNRGIVSAWDTKNNRPKGVTTPADMRTSLASIARADGIMLEAGAATITRPSTSMSIRWTAFTAVIASPLGGWLCPRIGAGQITLQAGHATYDRIDVIWVRQWDYQVSGDHPDSEVEVGVTTGKPAATPAAPKAPSGALAVFTVRVPKGAVVGSDIPEANVTRCRWTTPVGGMLAAATQTEADALVAGVPASPEAPVFAVIDGLLSAWNGARWTVINPPPKPYAPKVLTWTLGATKGSGLVRLNVGNPPSPFTRASATTLKVPGLCIVTVTVNFPGGMSDKSSARQFIEVASTVGSGTVYCREAFRGEDQATVTGIIQARDTVELRAYCGVSGSMTGVVRAVLL